MPGARHALTALAIAAVAVAGCGTGDTPGGDPGATTAGTAGDTPSASPSLPDEGSPTDGPPVDLGPVLDPAEAAPRTAGVAWQVDGAVLLTTTSGTPIGHLPGWRLDREASDHLAAPVLDGPDGPHAVTVDGLVPTGDPLPLAERHRLVLQDDGAVVLGPDDGEVARLEAAGPTDVWVSATGTVVGVVDGEHWDVEAGGPTEVEPGCRVADRHTADDPLLVCDDGTRLAGGTDLAAPDGGRFGWVTVGTTGDEVLATVATGERREVRVGSRAAASLDPVHDPGTAGAGLFFRANGDAWVARLGASSRLEVLVVGGAVSTVRDLPAASDAAMWTR